MLKDITKMENAKKDNIETDTAEMVNAEVDSVETGLIIASVDSDSISEELGIERGDILLSINEEYVNDTVEFRYHEASEDVLIRIKKNNGEIIDFEIEKDYYEELGLVFEDMISDPKTCTNKCIFCFIDQMPPGMRRSLYIKDDDSRMSFLQGSFVTLTNMKQEDIDRIIKYRISPINVSVHTTDPELRTNMLGNRFAGKIMDYLRQLADNNIEIKAQVVLCPEINDGENLSRTITDLMALWPSVSCLAIVPVGLTKYRTGLKEISTVTKEIASDVITLVQTLQEASREKNGVGFAFCSDEFYLIAERALPHYEEYEDFPQLENGVGLVTLFKEEIKMSLEDSKGLLKLIKRSKKTSGTRSESLNKKNHETEKHEIEKRETEKCKIKNNCEKTEKVITVLTGEYATPILEEALLEIENKLIEISKKEISKKEKRSEIKLNWKVISVKNDFFGHSVKVAGLLTGQDLMKSIIDNALKGTVLITESMLKDSTEIFLDDITIRDIEQKTQVKIVVVREDGSDFVEKVLG